MKQENGVAQEVKGKLESQRRQEGRVYATREVEIRSFNRGKTETEVTAEARRKFLSYYKTRQDDLTSLQGSTNSQRVLKRK